MTFNQSPAEGSYAEAFYIIIQSKHFLKNMFSYFVFVTEYSWKSYELSKVEM